MYISIDCLSNDSRVGHLSNSKEQGRIGEEKALAFLLKKGYALLERNYRFKKSEIDLIMKNDSTMIFIEVKFRRTSQFGHPEEFVSENQKRSIITGAEQYLLETNWEGNIRFDIVAVNAQFEIEHFEDAFY